MTVIDYIGASIVGGLILLSLLALIIDAASHE
jgi:hypothetical protein